MDAQNIGILKDIFNWYSFIALTEKEIQICAEKLNTQLPDNFLFKCTRKFHKKCEIFGLDRNPILFLKYVRDKYIFEVLGLHIAKNFFDPELCFRNYLTGLYGEKKPIPYIMTTYEEGEHIGKLDKTEFSKFRFLLGRQCYLHGILSLYDVHDRHFIVRGEKSLCRIDFGLCFESIQKKYLGFHDYLKHKKLDYNDEEFQNGYNYEKGIILNNLNGKQNELNSILRKIKTLKRDNVIVVFYPDRFVTRLIDHWSRMGFLEEAQLTEFEWD